MYEYQPPNSRDIVWLLGSSPRGSAYDDALMFLIDDAIYMVTLSVQLGAYDEFDFEVL